MNIQEIERDFRGKVSAAVRLEGEGTLRYRVLTPFMFKDGDHLSIVLKFEGNHWILTDEGNTYMHLSYHIDEKDLLQGTRQKVISDVLSAFQVEDRNGELLTEVRDGEYGDALFPFIQALIQVNDITYLNREIIRSINSEDTPILIEKIVMTKSI